MILYAVIREYDAYGDHMQPESAGTFATHEEARVFAEEEENDPKQQDHDFYIIPIEVGKIHPTEEIY